jgi:hypothetical protein
VHLRFFYFLYPVDVLLGAQSHGMSGRCKLHRRRSMVENRRIQCLVGELVYWGGEVSKVLILGDGVGTVRML